MTAKDKTCVEKPEQKESAGHQNKRVMIALVVLLGLTILVGGLLDLFFKGVPLGFTIPVLNMKATFSGVLYYGIVLFASIYIGVVGLKELVVEKRFSVEFLMAAAALGALYLNARFEAATVLFLIQSPVL